MMRELKICLKLLKYSYQFTLNMGCGIFFVVLGVINLLMGSVIGHSFLTGGLYIMVGPMMIQQMGCSLLLCNQVAASGQKRVLEGIFSSVIVAGFSVLAYGIAVGYVVILKNLAPWAEIHYGNALVALAVCMTTALIYYGFAYKKFVFGLILFVITFAVAFAWGCIWISRDVYAIGVTEGAIAGAVLVVLGNVAGIALRKIFYRKPLSKFVAGAALRKVMK